MTSKTNPNDLVRTILSSYNLRTKILPRPELEIGKIAPVRDKSPLISNDKFSKI